MSADRPAEAERLRRLFRFFAVTQCPGRSLVYETLSQGMAGDDALLDLLMRTPGEQRRPSLLFATVNLLLASHPGAALAAYYPVHGGRRPVDGQLMAAFTAFCTEHAEELGQLLRSRSTQTNEIRRCVALRLALSHVSRHWPGPLALAEMGASAGLNLLFDRYRYRVGDQEPGPATASPVLISCRLRGSASGGPILGTVPEISSRLGIDLDPVQLSDPGQRAWLEAFIWPEDIGGLATLRGAIELAVSTGSANVVRGDAATDTARLLAALPGREPVVVFTATLLSYLAADTRAAFVGQLQEAAKRRPVAWAFAEAPGLVAAAGLQVPALEGALAQRNALSLVGVSLLGPGQRDDSLLAMADPYLRWLAPARRAADDFQWLPAGPDLPRYCRGGGIVPGMGASGRRVKRPAEDPARVGELRGADEDARVAARPSLLRQLFGRATPYGGYTPAEASRAVAADDGEQGTAVVLAAEARPGRRFLNPPGGTVDLLLEVTRPGGDRYTTHLVVGFSTPERRARVATIGTRLPVRVNPAKPGKIAIDTAALFGQ